MTTEDHCAASSTTSNKLRKRRRWDQPDESLVSAGVAVPGIFPMAGYMGSLPNITLPPVPSTSLAIPFSACNATPLQLVQMPLQQHAASIVQKLIQPKIQDEIIAREIVINDADSAIRYKLTRRQTQEEIQRNTGAVVITRGKYRLPNAPPDGERPLYLHISASAHLETTAERIKAVDHAAAMVEEMLKQASVSNGVKVDHLLKTSVFLGFEAEPSLDIASRIRGPNDRYVNHIMNETGATVLLKGLGSGTSEIGQTQETQPLHLLLSSNDPKSLERAKLLAENLLDTISAEFGASRVSLSKVYGAVPPPPQLQAEVLSPGNASNLKDIGASCFASPGVGNADSLDPISQPIGLSKSGFPLPNIACYPHGLPNATSYNGYAGIYPQASPLQQVALALRQSTSPITATVAQAITAANADPPVQLPTFVKDKRSQKRKFQELPASVKGPANPNQKNLQESEFAMPCELTSHVGARDISVMQDPKKFVKPSSTAMPPPPPRSVTPPSPPPKFNSAPKLHGDTNPVHKSKPEVVPDTLTKLMEYGDDDEEDADDDDLGEAAKMRVQNTSSAQVTLKPFWAP